MEILYARCSRIIVRCISRSIYVILQFLCKTILTEECSVREDDIADFYRQFGYKKLSQFGQSFVMACVYDYVRIQYPYFGFVVGWSGNASSSAIATMNYEYKQRILGILNSRDWDKLFDTSTIHLFFHIHRTGNNQQIYRYVQYIMTRIQYRMLTFFSVWSMVAILPSPWVCALLVPVFFMYVYQEDPAPRGILYATSVVVSYASYPVVSVALLLIPYDKYVEAYRYVRSVAYPWRSMYGVFGAFIVYVTFGTWMSYMGGGVLIGGRIQAVCVAYLLVPLEDAFTVSFMMGMGLFSGYAVVHGIVLAGLCLLRILLRESLFKDFAR